MIKVFSDAPPDRVVELDSRIVRVLEPGVVRRLDPTVLPGTVVEEKRGRQGYEVQLWRIIKIADRIIQRELIQKTVYKPQDRFIRVGVSGKTS